MQFLVKCIKASFRTATLQSVTIFFRRKINLMYRYLSSAVRQDKTVFAVDLLCFYSFCHLCFFITHISHGMRYLISTSCCAVHLYVLYIDQWDQTIFNGMILLYTWESQIHPYHNVDAVDTLVECDTWTYQIHVLPSKIQWKENSFFFLLNYTRIFVCIRCWSTSNTMIILIVFSFMLFCSSVRVSHSSIYFHMAAIGLQDRRNLSCWFPSIALMPWNSFISLHEEV